MKYSLIVTAWNEPETVYSNLRSVLDPTSGNCLDGMEVVLVSPDIETRDAAIKAADQTGFGQLVWYQDQRKGKPAALQMAIEQAKGDVLICTDGDVMIEPSALPEMIKHFEDASVGGVTGRPVSSDDKSTLFGYFGNLLADAAHHKRTKEFGRGGFYFLSGYLLAFRRAANLKIPEKALVEDGWISLKLASLGYALRYAPEARVAVKYPKNFSEWLKQKKRSVGGYANMPDIGENVHHVSKNRSVVDELKFALFPITYARSFKELIYSILLYPARMWLWLLVFWERKVLKKSFESTWVRIESTK